MAITEFGVRSRGFAGYLFGASTTTPAAIRARQGRLPLLGTGGRIPQTTRALRACEADFERQVGSGEMNYSCPLIQWPLVRREGHLIYGTKADYPSKILTKGDFN